jgi:mono/diheme cytochrome c family protein
MNFRNMPVIRSIACALAGALSGLAVPAALAADEAPAAPPLYTVVDGYKVDHETMEGFRTWRAAGCDRCHGANQEGLVGPSLVESLKTLSIADFKKTLTEGRLEKGMPSWSANPRVMNNIDHLYSYLKGRSDGKITRARVEEIGPPPPQ